MWFLFVVTAAEADLAQDHVEICLRDADIKRSVDVWLRHALFLIKKTAFL